MRECRPSWSLEESTNTSLREQLGSLITSVEEVTKERDRLSEEKTRQEQEMSKKLVVSHSEETRQRQKKLFILYSGHGLIRMHCTHLYLHVTTKIIPH